MTTAPWKRRQQIPDQQVRDAADQFDEARLLLAAQGLGSGVVLPQINAAAMAVELYLKSLGAQKVYTPIASFPEASQIHAKVDVPSHGLVALLDAIPEDLRRQLEERFRVGDVVADGQPIRDVVRTYDGAFAASRYPFEEGTDVTRYDLDRLMKLSSFLRRFVADLKPIERIHW